MDVRLELYEMRAMLGFLLVVFISTSAAAQTKSGREEDRLVGAVQTVTTEVSEFTTKDGKTVEGPRLPVQTISYDPRGNRVKRVEFNRDGSIAQTLVYSYDAEGRCTGYEDYTPGLSAPRKHIYLLDQAGKRSEYKIIQPTGAAGDEKYFYKYDDKGNRIAEELYHKTSLVSRNENGYDEQGRLLTQVIYNPDGTVSSRIRNAIGADGKPVERVRYDGELLTYRRRYAYDAKGRLVEMETVGSYVEMDSSSESSITGKVVYGYKGDRVKEMTVYNPDGSLRERVVFDYDSRGNWVKRVRKVKSAQQIEYRVIAYYGK